MTTIQINRAYRKMWERMTRGDGYQMFGYDAPTLWLTRPAFMEARERLQKLHKEAKARENEQFNAAI